MSLASSNVHSQYVLFIDTVTEQEGVNGFKKTLRKRRFTETGGWRTTYTEVM